jgi:[lysine-biosynthesis-protein LysW]---L-2-aminoadipate ligase
MPPMSTFAIVAHRVTPTNARLGPLFTPAQALVRLGAGDVALGRLDVLPSLDGIEAGAWALDLLERNGVTVLNGQAGLTTAHDKLATAGALLQAGLRHPPSAHVAPWLPPPALEPPLVLKPRFGSWGRDVVRCDDELDLIEAIGRLRHRVWFNATGGIVQRLVAPTGYDLRLVVAGGQVVGAVRRVAPPGEWRTNVALGARRVPVTPPAEAAQLAIDAAAAVGLALAGVDLLPSADGWTVLEVNGAVDFSGIYAPGTDIFATVRDALVPAGSLVAA